MRQIETSRTIVFTAPRYARSFFEALLADNLDVGRPDTVELVFDRRIINGRKRATQGVFKTKVVTRGVDVTVNAFYQHSRIKQYLKDGRALRIETVVNSPTDLGCQRRLHNLDELQRKARAINTRLLDTERVGQGCVLASPAFARAAHPTIEEGRRAPALRFGDPRVMALAGALATHVHTVTALSNRSLRALMTGLLDVPYTIGQASYDLRRLRLKGIIERLPHSNTYTLTPDGQRFAIFYTKLHNRILVPLLAADQPPAPTPLRQALRTPVAHHVARDHVPVRLLAGLFPGAPRHGDYAGSPVAVVHVSELATCTSAGPVHGSVHRFYGVRHPQDGNGTGGR